MKVVFRSSFERDVKKTPPSIQNELVKVIDSVMAAPRPEEIPKIKKMTGYKNAYRIRVGDYRAGFFMRKRRWNLFAFCSVKASIRNSPNSVIRLQFSRRTFIFMISICS